MRLHQLIKATSVVVSILFLISSLSVFAETSSSVNAGVTVKTGPQGVLAPPTFNGANRPMGEMNPEKMNEEFNDFGEADILDKFIAEIGFKESEQWPEKEEIEKRVQDIIKGKEKIVVEGKEINIDEKKKAELKEKSQRFAEFDDRQKLRRYARDPEEVDRVKFVEHSVAADAIISDVTRRPANLKKNKKAPRGPRDSK